jgi:hypothetical protein
MTSFSNRTANDGQLHFFRISTPVVGDDLASADKLLQSFLPQWLQRGDYQKEFREWKAARGSPVK